MRISVEKSKERPLTNSILFVATERIKKVVLARLNLNSVNNS